MSAQPGWYDAGIPGQQRWWDGVQWTGHERAIAVAIQPQSMPQVTPMGWFPVAGTADVRWWDGRGWTPYRLREGRPRPDAFAIEPGNSGIVLGIVFLVLSVTQLSTYNLSGQPVFAVTPVLFFISGILWLIGGLKVKQVQKLPPPSTAPMFDPVTRPLPGDTEHPGAGWFPVAGQVARWWTGTQWSHYVAQKFGVRPTQYGPSAYRNSMIIGWVVVGLGMLMTLLGVAFGSVFAGSLGWWTAAALILPGALFALAGGAVLLTVYLRRYTMILPPYSPTSPLR